MEKLASKKGGHLLSYNDDTMTLLAFNLIASLK